MHKNTKALLLSLKFLQKSAENLLAQPETYLKNMENDQRQTQRSSQSLPVRLVLRNGINGQLLAGPADGNINNISTKGAGINISKIFINNHHLFYASQDNPDYILYLELTQPNNADNSISIAVEPVWFDRIQEEETHYFVVGVEFLPDKNDTKTKQLIQMIQDYKHERGSWLQNLVNKITAERKSKEALPDDTADK